jgi:hypothetical protein
MWCKYCVHMNVNGKMILAENDSRNEEWGGDKGER